MKKFLYIFCGLCIIFLIYYICLYTVKSLNIPFPAPILGVLVLFLLIKVKIIPEFLIKDSCNLVLKYMVLFFIPLFVGIIKEYELISKELIPIMLTILITTFFVMISVGLSFEYILKITRLSKMKGNKK